MDEALLRRRHLLLLDADVRPEDVDILLITRHPSAARSDDGAWKVSRHSSVIGPVPVGDAERAALQVGDEVVAVYALDCPVEREPEGPPSWQRDRDGLYRAFPAGLPCRDEGRFLELLIDIARRLHLSVRLADEPVTRPALNGEPGRRAGEAFVLTPDPADAVDLTVYSGYWLTPETLFPVVQRITPSAVLAVMGGGWEGPPPGLVNAPLENGADAALTPAQRVALHARADQADAEALAGEQVLDGYGITIDLGELGFVELRVEVAEVLPAALSNVDWGGLDVVSYHVRWMDDREERFLHERSEGFAAAREKVRPLVERVARAVVDAASGEIVDQFGFVVDRYQLG